MLNECLLVYAVSIFAVTKATTVNMFSNNASFNIVMEFEYTSLVENGLEGFYRYPDSIRVYWHISEGFSWIMEFRASLADCSSCPRTKAQLNYSVEDNLYSYSVTLVDGFTVPITIAPAKNENCAMKSCLVNINGVCPADYQVFEQGQVVACAPNYELFKGNCPDVVASFDDDESVASCDFSDELDPEFIINIY